MEAAENQAWDYIVVGSGAGGGTLAARLAENGMRVLLLEAGDDPRNSHAPRLPDDYDVPAFHLFACENPALSWDFRVRHYTDEATQARDPKSQDGTVLYPRASALGGCTTHNAMIFMLPHDSDWDDIAQHTGDASWRASNMRQYAQRIENCGHRTLARTLSAVGIGSTGHGWSGWLHTEQSMPMEALGDQELVSLVVDTAAAVTRGLPRPLASALRWLTDFGDPNARQHDDKSFEGICYTPLSTYRHRRVGARERVCDVAARHPQLLKVELNALVTRVLFDAAGAAVGVEFLQGAQLYRAHMQANVSPGELKQALATREVVLCGGAFNTPQLLMLSGIGPAAALRAHGIAVRVDLSGVGRNLQDRYEVGITHRMERPWQVLDGARFEPGDRLWQRWRDGGEGMYGSNGAAIAVIQRSTQAGNDPDIFAMALTARFEGYFTGFSKLLLQSPDYLTWAVLKAHTRNRAGTVQLRSADARDTPLINFNYFNAADDPEGRDLQAVVEAIQHVRAMTAPLRASGAIAEETLPGAHVDSPAALAEFVRDNAWGHHASCSCPIGAPNDGGVLDSNFAVHGTRRLRVVDASVFPKIPGFFVAAAVYMIAEKAADVILADARRSA